jgi:cyclase
MMTKRPARRAAELLVWLTLVAFASAFRGRALRARPLPSRVAAGFRAETLAAGVYAIRPTAMSGFGMDANSMLVVGTREALVVDAQFSASSTREVMTLVRSLTAKPVRWLVNTHWHDDHVSGNAEWLRAIPQLTIVSSTAMRDDMLRDGAKNRASFLASSPGTVRFLSERLATQRGLDDQPADSTLLAAFRAYITLIERFAAESASTHPTPPTRVFDDELTIDLGGVTARVVALGEGHTRSDVVVSVPSAGVVAAGDLVIWPVPFVGSTSYPRRYGSTLQRLLDVPHTVILPGHGEVQRDDAYVRLMRDMVVALSAQVDSLRRSGVPLDSVRAHLDVRSYRDRLVGSDRLRRSLWDVYVMASAIPKAYQDGARADSARPPTR